jgi:ATP-dependent Clp protease ATP-binding subunit ClpC
MLGGMFERFTEPAREIVELAQEEAHLMRHAHVGTEHLLVALARAGDQDAGGLLVRYGLTGEKARAEVVRVAGLGDGGVSGRLPLTPAAHDALDSALREAMLLGHERVEPPHLLLGILRQSDALARRILLGAGAAPRDVRAELIERLGGPRLAEPAGQREPDGRLLLEILERRGAVAAWLRERGVDEEAVRRMLEGI